MLSQVFFCFSRGRKYIAFNVESFVVIIIKKYPNRRLYDTSKSQYINLAAIETLVKRQQEFKVIDSRSEKDLTKSILLQIITEQESVKQQTILNQNTLGQIIRFYGSDMQTFLSHYIEQCVTTFVEQQDSVQGVLQEFMEQSSPVSMLKQAMSSNDVSPPNNNQAEPVSSPFSIIAGIQSNSSLKK